MNVKYNIQCIVLQFDYFVKYFCFFLIFTCMIVQHLKDPHSIHIA